MSTCPFLSLGRWRQLLDHRYANRIDDFICVLGVEIVVVAQDRKHESSAVNRSCIARESIAMPDGSRFRKDATGCSRTFHAL